MRSAPGPRAGRRRHKPGWGGMEPLTQLAPQKLRTVPRKGVVHFTLPTPTPHFLLGSHSQRVLGVAASRQESGNFELGECGATDRV